jgi:ribonuclease P protein component
VPVARSSPVAAARVAAASLSEVAPASPSEVLPASHRLTGAEQFRAAVRRGRRAAGRRLVVHALTANEPAPVRIGLVVSRAVGPAVVRNRVKRRLRHLLRERLPSLPGAGLLVVRALPAAATATYAELGEELDGLLARSTGLVTR